MTDSIDCPICPRTDIDTDRETCPGCGADLSPLLRLAELPRVCFNRALEAHADGDLDAAIARADCAVALDPQFTAARLLLGKLLWQSGRKEQALGHWVAVAEYGPVDAEAERLLSSVGDKAGMKERLSRFLSRR